MTKRFFLFVLATLAALAANAAPIPLTTSSALLTQKPGVYISPLGFRVDASDTGWSVVDPQGKSEFIVAAYVKEKGDPEVQGAFTVRVDNLSQPTSAEEYAKKWLKDYPRLGFEILTAKTVKVEGQIGFLLDLVNRDNKMQLRQLLFTKRRHVVNLACRDQMKDFTNTLNDCNKIFRSFSW